MPISPYRSPPSPRPFRGVPSRNPSFGRTTQEFFVEGEQHEAADWQDVVLPPDDEPDPSVHSGSFDEIPRRRGATVALVVLAAALGFGIVAGARFFLSTGRKVDAAKAAYTRPPENQPEETDMRAPAQQPAAGVAEPAVPPPEQGASDSTVPPEEKAATTPIPGHEGSPAVAAPAPEPTAAPVQRPPRPRAKQSRALRNYVWSPTAHALVLVDSTSAALAATSRGADTLLPPAEKPSIEPANTGAPAPERAASTARPESADQPFE